MALIKQTNTPGAMASKNRLDESHMKWCIEQIAAINKGTGIAPTVLFEKSCQLYEQTTGNKYELK